MALHLWLVLWNYGTSTFKKSYDEPTNDRCLKCFRYAGIKGVPEIDISDLEPEDS